MTGRGLVSVVFKQTEGGSRPFYPANLLLLSLDVMSLMTKTILSYDYSHPLPSIVS